MIYILTPEQKRQIELALANSRSITLFSTDIYAHQDALDLMKSLKPSEPVACFVQHLEYGNAVYHQVAKRYNSDSDVIPLYAQEKSE